MSKTLIYILDRFVCILLIAVITGQALQIAGVLDSPKGISLGEITYNEQKEYEYKMGVADPEDGREKRQAGDRSPLIDNLFNVPIATLNAVNDLLQVSRPAFQRLREAARRRLEASNPNNGNNEEGTSNGSRTKRSKDKVLQNAK